MSGQCCNKHQKKADGLTIISAIGEGGASLINNWYWASSTFDTATGFKGDILPLSWMGLAIGFVLASLTATGASYSHMQLNKNHQKSSQSSHSSECDGHVSEQTELLPAPEQQSATIQQHAAHDDVHASAGLAWWQYLALFGDFCCHTGNIAGAFIFLYAILSADRAPTWVTVAVQCTATFFAGVASIANVRTCHSNLPPLQRGQAQQEASESATSTNMQAIP